MKEEPQIRSADFFAASVDRFGQWLQFEDAKAGVVLVILGIALSDLLGKAGALIHAHKSHSGWGGVASVSFWVAVLSAAAVLALVIFALTPRIRARRPSVYFFGTVGTYGDPTEYESAVAALDDTALAHQMASQAWQLGAIAQLKARIVGWAFWFVAIFLVAWTPRLVLLPVRRYPARLAPVGHAGSRG
jgi:Family of unknown function (DUF5706)